MGIMFAVILCCLCCCKIGLSTKVGDPETQEPEGSKSSRKHDQTELVEQESDEEASVKLNPIRKGFVAAHQNPPKKSSNNNKVMAAPVKYTV
jgi:hypothetical protein